MSLKDISDCERAIEELETLYERREISLESYRDEKKILEEKLYKLQLMTLGCPECGKKITRDSKTCPNCGLELTRSSSIFHKPLDKKLPSLWYLVPILFGLIGGLIGYVGVKDEDKEMADALLAIGVIITIIEIFAIWWLVYASSLASM